MLKMRAFSVLAVLAICATCAVQCVPLDKKLEDSDINSIVSTERTERVSKDGQDEPTDEDFSLVPRERDEICETDCIAGNSEEDSEESSEARALGSEYCFGLQYCLPEIDVTHLNVHASAKTRMRPVV